MIDDGRPLLASVVIALGSHSSPALPAVRSVLAELAGRADAELIIVDDVVAKELRAPLAHLAGNVRVLHNFPAYGTRGALAAGAQLAQGSVLVLVGDDVVLPAGALDTLLGAFGVDPGLGVVVPTVRRRGGPVSGYAGLHATPLVACTRVALDSIGGVGRLGDTSGAPQDHTAPGRRAALVPDAVFAALLAAGWRRGVAAVELDHDGLARLEGADPSSPRRPLDRPHWAPPPLGPPRAHGLNVVGLLEAVCGIGDAGRRYAEAVADAGVADGTYAYHGHGSPEVGFRHAGTADFSYDTNLLVLNPDLLFPFGVYGGEELWADRYTIGLWFWELETVNDVIRRGYRYVNELWAATDFIRDALASETDKTVRTVPLPVRRRDGRPARSRAALAMPEAFTFLTIFDFGSVAARKNSVGVVRAFRATFAPGEGPVLVLKTLNAAWDRSGWQALVDEVGGRRDIVVLDGYLSDEAVSELIGHADCYVSLHRAEGFGLTPAEAMAWGRPVIATGYSGNLDFMTRENSYLVDFDEGTVPESLGRIYPAGTRWAEPRLADAVRYLREIYADPAAANARGRRGQRDIRRSHGIDTVAKVIVTRLEEIGRERSRRPVVGRPSASGGPSRAGAGRATGRERQPARAPR